MTNLGLRTITALALSCLALSLTYIGGLLFALFIILLCSLVFYEYQRIVQPYFTRASRLLGWIVYMAVSLLVLANSPIELALSITLVFSLLFLVPIIFSSSANTKSLGVKYTYAFWCSLGFLYSTLPLLSLVYLRKQQTTGFITILYLFAVVWGSDTGGYFGGKLLGGAKLAAKISPNKTWSGAICGVAVAIFLASLIRYFGDGHNIECYFVIWVVALSVIAQIGDLLESMLKRRFAVKDSGRLLPGHGGVMDRVDGLLFIALFYLVTILI